MIETSFVPIGEAATELKTTEDRLLLAAIDLRIELCAFATAVLTRELSAPPGTVPREQIAEMWDEPEDPEIKGIALMKGVIVSLDRQALIGLWAEGEAFISGVTDGGWTIHAGGLYETISPHEYAHIAQKMNLGRLFLPRVAKSQLLIFQEVLEKLKRGETPPPCSVKAGMTETERGKMLALILGMAMDAYGYDPGKARNAATGENRGSIHTAISRFGLKVDSDTIRRYITEAAKLYPLAKPHKT